MTERMGSGGGGEGRGVEEFKGRPPAYYRSAIFFGLIVKRNGRIKSWKREGSLSYSVLKKNK